MTVENCIKNLEKYKKSGNKAAYENMKSHILSSKKFAGHPIIAELTEVKKEVVENGSQRKTRK